MMFLKPENMKVWSYYKEPWDSLLRFTGFGVMDLGYETSRMRFFGYFNMFLLAHYILSGFMFSHQQNWTLEAVSESLMLTVVAYIMIVQMYAVIKNKHLIRELVLYIEKDWKDFQSNPIYLDILYKRGREGYVTLTSLYILMILSVMCFSLNALIHYKSKALHQIFSGFGFSRLDGIYYVVNFCYSQWIMSLACNCLVPYIAYFVNFLLQLVAQIDMLSYRMRMVGEEMTDDEEITQFLRYFYFKQLDLIKNCHSMRQLFGTVLFLQIFVSGGIFTLCLFRAMGSDNPLDMNTVRLVVYMAACMLHLFIFCWYGEILYTSSQAFADSIYTGSWYTLRSRQQEDILMLMQGASVPIYISVGEYWMLRLDTFTSVVKSAYSYCAVLSTMQE